MKRSRTGGAAVPHPTPERRPGSRAAGARPQSAGILLYRRPREGLRVLLAHPGGPFFAKRDAGAWGIPKGLVNPGEELSAAALREFAEEVGWTPSGALAPLGSVKLSSGKTVTAFAVLADAEEGVLLSRFAPGAFTMEWPPRSGRTVQFPEVDRITFFSLPEARMRINERQGEFLDRLEKLAAGDAGASL